jgi:hypothetical protein
MKWPLGPGCAQLLPLWSAATELVTGQISAAQQLSLLRGLPPIPSQGTSEASAPLLPSLHSLQRTGLGLGLRTAGVSAPRPF